MTEFSDHQAAARVSGLYVTPKGKMHSNYCSHNMEWSDDQWVAVWWPGFATLLPSSRKSSGSNFFLFLLTVWNVGSLLLLFIIWVIIFPDISSNKEMPQVHPQGPPLLLPNSNFMKYWPCGVRHSAVWLEKSYWSDSRICGKCRTSTGWLKLIKPIWSKQIPSYNQAQNDKNHSMNTDWQHNDKNRYDLCKTTGWIECLKSTWNSISRILTVKSNRDVFCILTGYTGRIKRWEEFDWSTEEWDGS